MNSIVIIPIRSGLKGLKDKNIRRLNSGDKAGRWDVVRKVLSEYHFNIVCLFQPISHLRTAEDIVTGYRELENKNADAITAVCEMYHSPLWFRTLDKGLSLTEFRRGLAEVSRQLLKTYYRINSALYIRKIVYKESAMNILNGKEYAYIMNRNRSVDIDTTEDFKYAEFINRGRGTEKSNICVFLCAPYGLRRCV